MGALPRLRQGPGTVPHPLQPKVGSMWLQPLLGGGGKERLPVTGGLMPGGLVSYWGTGTGARPSLPSHWEQAPAGAWGTCLEGWVTCDGWSRHWSGRRGTENKRAAILSHLTIQWCTISFHIFVLCFLSLCFPKVKGSCSSYCLSIIID